MRVGELWLCIDFLCDALRWGWIELITVEWQIYGYQYFLTRVQFQSFINLLIFVYFIHGLKSDLSAEVEII